MIARTEVSMAQNAGTLEAGRQARAAGLNVRKVWTLGPNPCPQCEDAAAAEGDIDLEDDFGSDAGDAPPLHPNCQCSLDLFVADDQEEEEPEEEEPEMQDLKAATRKRFERVFKADTSDDDDSDDDERGDNGDADHVVSQIADLLVEAGNGEVSRQAAMHWLLNTPGGRALIGHLSRLKRATNTGKDFQMTRDEQLRATVKRHGNVVGLAKFICSQGVTDISEHELTSLAVDAAKRQYGISDDAKAFAKMFTDTGPTGDTLRRAIQIAKVSQASGDDGDDGDAAAALEELHRLAEQHHRDNPELTPDQSFARVFADPRNAALAARAHRRPVANEKMLYPFPR